MACIFGKLEIRTLILNRFKNQNQTDDTLKLLDCNSNNQQGFVKQKMLLSITMHNRATVDTNVWSNVVPVLRKNCYINKVYPK